MGDQKGQAAVESLFSVLLILLLMLASGQILYASLIANEAVQKAHRAALERFREMNANNNLEASYEEITEYVEEDPVKSYALIVNGWSLFHKKGMKAQTKYGEGGEKYKSTRTIYIATGPLKGPGGQIDSAPNGKSAFGEKKGGGFFPDSDGDGYNDSGSALRNDAFEELAEELEIDNTYF